jgi:hypothetical protein
MGGDHVNTMPVESASKLTRKKEVEHFHQSLDKQQQQKVK